MENILETQTLFYEKLYKVKESVMYEDTQQLFLQMPVLWIIN